MNTIGHGLESFASASDVVSVGRRAARRMAETLLPERYFVTRGRPSERRIALTFDDGPDPLTHDYLDVLDAHDAKASFFVLGHACALRQDDVSEIAERGHEVSSHGYTHRLFSSMRRSELAAELELTRKLLPQSSTPSKLVRPPRGALSLGALYACASAGYTTVLWSRDSDDCRVADAGTILETFRTDPIAGGDIVLFHEGQRWTLELLPRLIDDLKEAGHELVTVSDLLFG